MSEFALPNMPSGTRMKMSGNVDVVLPRYMTALAQHQIDQVKRARRDMSRLIVAVGFESISGDIVLLTGDGRFIEVNAEANGLPPLHCIPTDHGATVMFPDTRMEIASEALIGMARHSLVEIDGDIRC